MVLTREPNALFRSVSNSTELLRIPVEDEEKDILHCSHPSKDSELLLEPGVADVERRIFAVEHRNNFKVASESRMTAMLQLLLEDHARLQSTLAGSRSVCTRSMSYKLPQSTSFPAAPPVQPRAGTSSSVRSVRAEAGNRLLMDAQSQCAPRKVTKLMQVLPEGEPTVLPRQSDAKEAGCLSVKQVVAERAAQQSRLRSASCTFEADLPLLLQGPESRIGSCCFKFWRGVLAVCGAAAMWDPSRTDAAQRCRHFLHVAVSVVLSILAVLVGLIRFISLVQQEAEVLGALTSGATFTTDVIVGLAAPLCLSVLGGVTPGTYARRMDYLRDSLRYLGVLLNDNKLTEEWRSIVGKDLVRLTSAWFLICTLRVASTLLLHDLAPASVACMLCFVVFASVLTAVGFVLIATWRGLGLRVQRFTDPFREEDVDLAIVQATLLPAALASSACARFPSFVAIYDPGPEMAENFIRFANFVAMTDCGCFLWETKLTAGLLQRAMSITIALAAAIYRSGILVN
ncbi:PYK [Symbiodinium natans]|uniref:PYK protein n=1 Tax=Symbiodinium natans TaxID=878477 RepID=A0A812HIX8_9DINO|nr:PYK [Symbiodinium natans]